jgi:Rod binding domain-containing protein
MSHPIPAVVPPGHAETGPAEAPKDVKRAAREFEEVFLRTLLEPLTKMGKLAGGQGASPGGQNAYSSMIVDALSDAITRAGGLGLSDLLERGLMQAVPRPPKR